jgi:hypothetical protein
MASEEIQKMIKEINNIETLIDYIKDKQGQPYYHSGFIDIHEPAIIDNYYYRQLQPKKYKYFVSNKYNY